MNKEQRRLISGMIYLGVLAIALLCFAAITLTGCKLITHSQKSSHDTTAVKKSTIEIDANNSGGSVKKDTGSKTSEFEWWRIAKLFPRDTNVTNVYPQPTAIIYEGGKGKSEETHSAYDSTFYINIMKYMNSRIDSINSHQAASEHSTEMRTNGLGLVTIILIAAGAVLLNRAMIYAGNNFSINKINKNEKNV